MVARTFACAAALLARSLNFRYDGIAIASRIPMMMMTTRSSMRVKPSSLFSRVCNLFNIPLWLLPSTEVITGGEGRIGSRSNRQRPRLRDCPSPAAGELDRGIPGEENGSATCRRRSLKSGCGRADSVGMSEVVSIDQLLGQMVQLNASDLHVTVGAPPVVRLRGHLQRFEGVPSMSAEDTRDLLYRVLSSEQQKRLELNRQLDFAHSIPGVARFRVNVFFQRETLGAAFRLIPNEIKSLEELGLSSSLHSLAEKPRGLVLVTGPTGSGKSTTLASVLDEINRTRHDHILTVEDPIEFLHRHKGCIVNQREIGVDAISFADGLRGALRQDPDVILVGEMRDLETIATAMTAAETGHLVFGTLHTQSAPGTIDRIIDVFPPEQQEQVRV